MRYTITEKLRTSSPTLLNSYRAQDGKVIIVHCLDFSLYTEHCWPVNSSTKFVLISTHTVLQRFDEMLLYIKHFLSCIFGAHLSSCIETDKFSCYKRTWSHNINERKRWTLQTSGIQFIQFLPKGKIFFLCELHSFHTCNDSESIKKSWLPKLIVTDFCLFLSIRISRGWK